MGLNGIYILPTVETSEADTRTALEIAHARDGRAKIEIPQKIGAALKRMRKAKAMSQANVARLCGLTFQQIQKYEMGLNTPPIYRLIRMADALGFDPVVFLGEIIADFSSGKEASGQHTALDEMIASRCGAELAMLFTALPQRDRAALLRLARHLADADV